MTDKTNEHPISPDTEQFISECPEAKVVHVPRIGEQPKLDAPKHDPQLAYCPCDSCMAPTAAPLEAREWLKGPSGEQFRKGAKYVWDTNEIPYLMAAYSTHVNSGLLEKLAKFEANPSRGAACFICGATMWLRDAYMEECGKPFHPMCKVAKRAEAAEARISVLERERDASIKELGKVSREAGTLESQLSTLREALNAKLTDLIPVTLWKQYGSAVDKAADSGALKTLRNAELAIGRKFIERALTPPTEPQGETK